MNMTPEEIKERISNYEKARKKAWKLANKEREDANNKAYREANKEKRINQVKEWRKANPVTAAKHAKRWRQANPSKIAASNAKRRATKLNQTPDLTLEENNKINDLYKECRRITKETGIQHHVDHIKPLSKGGLHHPDNLQILTAKENLSKGTSY